MEKDTGGLAFPLVGSLMEIQEAGMTLRDYFAAKALQGLISSDVQATMDEFASHAYAMADAMLRARG